MPHKRTILRDLRDDLKVAARVWSKVDRRAPNQCWPWTGSRIRTGYGRIGVDGKNAFANRVVWVLTHGPIPQGFDVLHHCDNPPCCNPTHLFLGDHSENMRDRERKGRHNAPRGSKHGIAKLTEDAVIAIRERRRQGERGDLLAAEFGVSPSAIGLVVRYKNWKHVQ